MKIKKIVLRKKNTKKQKKKPENKFKASTKDFIRTRLIKGGKFRFTRKGLKMLKSHPLVYEAVNEIVSVQLAGLNLLDPKLKTKKIRNHEIIKLADSFKKQVNLFDKQAPFFKTTHKMDLGKYIIEKVSPPQGAINIGMYRITSNKGESILVKLQPQKYTTSEIENLEIARKLGFRTPDYFLEFDFPKFNVQVMETMKLPTVKQFRKKHPIQYRAFVRKAFIKEAQELRKTFLDAEAENCLLMLRGRGIKKRAYFYWIDLF